MDAVVSLQVPFPVGTLDKLHLSSSPLTVLFQKGKKEESMSSVEDEEEEEEEEEEVIIVPEHNKIINDLGNQWRLQSARASTQSDQSSLCTLWVAKDRLTAKTLIGLGVCPGWYEPLLGAQVFLVVMSCSGNIFA